MTPRSAKGPRRRHAVLAPLALLVTLVVAGCQGEDQFESYCSVVKAEQTDLTELLARNDASAGLLPALPVFERLEDAAPDDIADDWSVIVQRLTSLSEALKAANVDPVTYDPVDPPDALTSEEQEAIALAAGSVGTEAVREALENVQQQSRDVCKTELAI